MHVTLKHFFLATIIIVDRHFFFSNDPCLMFHWCCHTAVSDVLFQSHLHFHCMVDRYSGTLQ